LIGDSYLELLILKGNSRMVMRIYLDDWVGMDSGSRRTHGRDTLALNLQYTAFLLFTWSFRILLSILRVLFVVIPLTVMSLLEC
jgi:hypothetical protein